MQIINLVEKNNLYCDPKNNFKPYTGKIEGNVEGFMIEGMLHGTWVEYFDNGKSWRKKRFYGYIRGNGQSTNSKIHKKLVKERSGKILILSLNDVLPFNWGIYNINLAAGLEDSIIEIENPLWNGKCSETEINEESSIENHSKIIDKFFIVSLSKTYFEIGSINVPLRKSDLLGEHKDIITIGLSKDNKHITTQINRNAVKNRSVRINPNKEIKEYYNKFYKIGDKVKITITDEGNLIIE